MLLRSRGLALALVLLSTSACGRFNFADAEISALDASIGADLGGGDAVDGEGADAFSGDADDAADDSAEGVTGEDADATCIPSAEGETCSGMDDDCDGAIDEKDALGCRDYFVDADGDSFGAEGSGLCLCAATDTHTATLGGDQDDDDLTSWPGAPELCDGVDNDLDPATLDGADEPWLAQVCDGPDLDACKEGTLLCDVEGKQRCDEPGPAHPDLCDGVDNDCNPATADGSAEPWIDDACDGDDEDLCAGGVLACVGGDVVCDDDSGESAVDTCDGTDDDCDLSTPDGAGESWFGLPCDGDDTDACADGVFGCLDGVQQCSDAIDAALDLCDGIDNDCDPATADGADEAWLGDLCDGVDVDLCETGVLICQSGEPVCQEEPAAPDELCDGVDNDCNPLTPDGADEAWFGTSCDGIDADSCAEGSFVCQSASQTCDDPNDPTLDVCDGVDNDCDPTTPDGAHESWFGLPCDGLDTDNCDDGALSCDGAGQLCDDDDDEHLEQCDGLDNDCDAATLDGEAEPWFGAPCDGADSDVCLEGVLGCGGATGGQACSDDTPSNVEVDDGVDNDCDGSIDEGLGDDFCDGIDNDGDPGTPDGNAEPWFGLPCDGDDADLCQEGTLGCDGVGQVCSDTSGDEPELCDGVDNDCDPATVDGADEPTFGDDCDGSDSDLCKEGTIGCLAGSLLVCLDGTPDNLELCDGLDNDCDPNTADGLDEAWRGDACDGGDSDACLEGQLACVLAAPFCDEPPGDALELCDGLDNDCDDSTPDGVDEPLFAASCDGLDADLCEEGSFICDGVALVCDDFTLDTPELCDDVDNDCDPSTPDGLDETWLTDACDSIGDLDLCAEGSFVCQGGAQVCLEAADDAQDLCDGVDNDCDPATADGAHDPGVGLDCDGPDTDMCLEGTTVCDPTGISCDDLTASTVEGPEGDVSCGDSVDNDCDGITDGADAGCWSTPPVGIWTVAPGAGLAGLTEFFFDATGTFDLEDLPGALSYEWDFDGDDVTDATGPTATFTFATAGEHDVTLLVTDTSLRQAALTGRIIVQPAPPQLIIVTTEADSVNPADGVISLREAIEAANSAPGPETITFDGPRVIVLSSLLPAIVATDPVSIVGEPGVVIDGSGLTGSKDCLELDSNGHQVLRLRITGCPQYGVDISGNDNTVAFVEIDNCMRGAALRGDANTFGPHNRCHDNIERGPRVYGSNALVVGNLVFGNGLGGVSLKDNASNATIQLNTIWGNAGPGIEVEDLASGGLIYFNTVDANTSEGVLVEPSGMQDHTVVGNILTNNGLEGLADQPGDFVTLDANLFFGNGGAGPCVACTPAPSDVFADPEYLDLPTADRRIGPASLAVDAAPPVPGIDKNDALVGEYGGAAPDMGAAEVP